MSATPPVLGVPRLDLAGKLGSTGALATGLTQRGRLHALCTSSRWFVEPGSFGKHCWDVLMLLCTMYFALATPYDYAFSSGYSHVRVISDTAVDMLFVVDILLRCNTALTSEDGDIITDRKQIVLRYLRTWLIPDLLWCFPLQLFALKGSFRVIRGVLLLRTLRIFRYSYVWMSLGSRGRLAIVRVVKEYVYFLVLIHWVGCLWYVIASVPPPWPQPASYSTWVDVHGLRDATPQVKYTASLYWAATTLCTVGYGDISATNSVEQLFATVVMCIGALLYALLFGVITSLVSSMSHTENEHLRKMDAVNQYLADLELPKALQSTVKGYYEFLWSRRKDIDVNKVHGELPLILRSQVARYRHLHMVSRSPALTAVEPEFIQLLALMFEDIIATPGEMLFDFGDPALHVFFVKVGNVTILNSKHETVSSRKVGGVFGDDGLVPACAGDTAVAPDATYTTAAVCRLYCELYAVNTADLVGALVAYPEVQVVFQEVAGRRREAAAASSLTGVPYDDIRLQSDVVHVLQTARESSRSGGSRADTEDEDPRGPLCSPNSGHVVSPVKSHAVTLTLRTDSDTDSGSEGAEGSQDSTCWVQPLRRSVSERHGLSVRPGGTGMKRVQSGVPAARPGGGTVVLVGSPSVAAAPHTPAAAAAGPGLARSWSRTGSVMSGDSKRRGASVSSGGGAKAAAPRANVASQRMWAVLRQMVLSGQVARVGGVLTMSAAVDSPSRASHNPSRVAPAQLPTPKRLSDISTASQPVPSGRSAGSGTSINSPYRSNLPGRSVMATAGDGSSTPQPRLAVQAVLESPQDRTGTETTAVVPFATTAPRLAAPPIAAPPLAAPPLAAPPSPERPTTSHRRRMAVGVRVVGDAVEEGGRPAGIAKQASSKDLQAAMQSGRSEHVTLSALLHGGQGRSRAPAALHGPGPLGTRGGTSHGDGEHGPSQWQLSMEHRLLLLESHMKAATTQATTTNRLLNDLLAKLSTSR